MGHVSQTIDPLTTYSQFANFFRTTGGSFSTYLGCSPPVRFVSLFNSLFRNFVGGFAWGTQLTPDDAVKGMYQGRVHQEREWNQQKGLFVSFFVCYNELMSNFCTYLLFTVVQVLLFVQLCFVHRLWNAI